MTDTPTLQRGDVPPYASSLTNCHQSVNGAASRTNVNKTTYLVTGASRGIGKGLVASFLQRPDSVVVACVRDVASATETMNDLPKAPGAEIIILKLDAASTDDPAVAAKELQSTYQVLRIDVAIANAAIAANYGPTSTMRLEDLQRHMMINTYAVLLLFQALKPLMEKAPSRQAKFVLIGAPISTITEMEKCARAPLSAYGLSKLAANYIVRKLHFENNWLTSFVIDPGHVQTDMGAQGARLMGRKEAPTTLEASVNGICTRIDKATKEQTSGQFVLWEDGSQVPW